jgi:hypothetical protein
MPELVVSTFDVTKLSHAARKLMKTAVRRAYAHQDVKKHTVRIDEFCRESGLRPTTSEQFRRWMREARKSLAVVEVIDTDLPNRDDLPYSSWPVFLEIRSNATEVTFEIDSQTFSGFSKKVF